MITQDNYHKLEKVLKSITKNDPSITYISTIANTLAGYFNDETIIKYIDYVNNQGIENNSNWDPHEEETR